MQSIPLFGLEGSTERDCWPDLNDEGDAQSILFLGIETFMRDGSGDSDALEEEVSCDKLTIHT